MPHLHDAPCPLVDGVASFLPGWKSHTGTAVGSITKILYCHVFDVFLSSSSSSPPPRFPTGWVAVQTVIKVRLQTQRPPFLYRSSWHAVQRIVAEEGLFAAWGGLWLPGMGASILREVSYSSLRFGLYSPAKAVFGDRKSVV